MEIQSATCLQEPNLSRETFVHHARSMLFEFDDLIVGAVKLDGGESIVDYMSFVFWQIHRIAKKEDYTDIEVLSNETDCYLERVKNRSIRLDYQVVLRFMECRYLMADLLNDLIYIPVADRNTASRLNKLLAMMRQDVSDIK